MSFLRRRTCRRGLCGACQLIAPSDQSAVSLATNNTDSAQSFSDSWRAKQCGPVVFSVILAPGPQNQFRGRTFWSRCLLRGRRACQERGSRKRATVAHDCLVQGVGPGEQMALAPRYKKSSSLGRRLKEFECARTSSTTNAPLARLSCVQPPNKHHLSALLQLHGQLPSSIF
jgi:hypothetical protein